MTAGLRELPAVFETQQPVFVGQFLRERVEGACELQYVHHRLVELRGAARAHDDRGFQRAVREDRDFDVRIARSRCTPCGGRKVQGAETLDLVTPGHEIRRDQRLTRVGRYPQLVAVWTAYALLLFVIDAELFTFAVAVGLQRDLGHLCFV